MYQYKLDMHTKELVRTLNCNAVYMYVRMYICGYIYIMIRIHIYVAMGYMQDN